MKRLGDNQKVMLASLKERGPWHAGCGWYWDNTSGTTRIMESLVRQGLVTKQVEKRKYGRFGGEYEAVTYTLKENP